MYEVGQLFESKKPHACGKNEWTIIRVGSDYKIKCNFCNRIILLAKDKLDKMVKKLK